ncbi:MAG: transglycosylase domain-containing protein [Candidatus Sacchiramonaceae bacterium]|nr:transglycosylase domain-containing protein [Candidatus Saccharimonadaceae bacterium]
MEKKAKKTVKKSARTRQKSLRSTRKKTEKKNNLGLYANLVHRKKTKKDAAARKKAEYLATLPKNPFLRFLYRLHPKRFFKYWFSKEGGIMALKILGGLTAVGLIVIFSLFAYFQKDLAQLRPGELSKRVQTTVNKYYDRNDELLWEDKGEDDYKLVVDSDKIGEYMKQATVAIEDRDFYKHKGVDLWALMRATINNLRGGATQGGSTLTQQLIKQVYFADEAAERGIKGVPRKI